MKRQPICVDISEAAELTGVHENTIRRAIKATDSRTFPPPLAARKAGGGPNARLLFLVDDLTAWVKSFPAA